MKNDFSLITVNNWPMLLNYVKIAWRNLWRNKGFSTINILGLALGIATCLLILIFVTNELSYDRYNTKSDRIVRVVFKGKMEGGGFKESNVMPPVAQAFKTDFPEIEQATRIRSVGTPRISYGDKTFKEEALGFVDSNFFQVFTIPFLAGDSKTALLEPNCIVISASFAHKYFGTENPIGKILVFKDQHASLKVTGLFGEIPRNSHFHFGALASMSTLPEARENSWMTSNFYTYLLLPEGYNYKKLEAKLPAEVEKYIGPRFQQAMGISYDQFRKKGNSLGFFLQPITDIHLRSDLDGDLEPYGDIRYVYIFSAVGLFMLLIACINFMNLSTASASKRAKEVGIRKVMGSVKGQLIWQFLMESVMLSGLALILALVLVYWALPFFGTLAGQDLHLHLRSNPMVIAFLIGFGLLTGFLAGSYPAFFLSSFNPITVLKGRFSNRSSGSLRNALVVFQFFISICLIVGTVVVFEQLSYIQNKKLGYDKDQVLVIQETYWLGNNLNVFRQQLLQDPRILGASSSGYLPAGPSNSNNYLSYPDDRSSQLVKTLRYEVDYGYIPTLGMEIVKGRNFSKDFGTDSDAVIVNQAAVKEFGWGEDVIGRTLSHTENDGKKSTYHVVGIVKDFNFHSLHELISPLIMTLGSDNSNLIVKVKTKDIHNLIGSVEKTWTSLHPDAPFSYSFLDDRFNNMYKAEMTIGRILGLFAALTIFVASLGLFGLATFTAEQRTREIGIRKVLGASVSGIIALLSKDFLKLVLIAFVIAAPVAWIVMNRWLQDFQYRISINGWVLVLAALLAVTITMISIGIRTVRAATANPTKSLRSE